MKILWSYKYEVVISSISILLVINFFCPSFMSAGLQVCLTILFLVSLIVMKLSAKSEMLKKKVQRGGIL